MSEKMTRAEKIELAIWRGLRTEGHGSGIIYVELEKFLESLNSHGYAIVPIEPSEVMRSVGSVVVPVADYSVGLHYAAAIWSAMLKAAEEE